MSGVEILEGTAEDDLAANKLEVAKARAEQSGSSEVLEGTGAEASLPPEAEVSWTKTGLAASIALPLLVPVVLRYYTDKTQATLAREETISELRFGRPFGSDLDYAQSRPEADFSRAIAQRSCAKEMPAMTEQKFGVAWSRMDAADRVRISQCVAYFLTSGRKTGR